MSQILKQKIAILFTLAVLLMTLIGFLFLNKSLAWFSENTEVAADGFSLSSSVSSNLIIGKNPEDLTADNLSFSVDFDEASRGDMVAVTHNDEVADTFLEYPTNAYAIDRLTGLAKDEEMDIGLTPVTMDDTEKYFIDFTVYIASAFDEIYASKLVASIVIPNSVDDQFPYFYAASIDFFVGEANSDGFIATLSVADSLKGKTVDLFKGEGKNIPLNTSNDYVKVIMRCYFDGALTDESGNAYINTHTVKANKISLGVNFTAVDGN